MQAGHHEQHPEEGPGQARGEGGSGSGVMLRVTLMLAKKILEFSELFRGTAMCIAIAHARMVQYAKHSHCTCQPMGQRLKRSPFTRAYKVALVRSYTLYLYDLTRVPVTCNCVQQCLPACHSCKSVRGAVLCDD